MEMSWVFPMNILWTHDYVITKTALVEELFNMITPYLLVIYQPILFCQTSSVYRSQPTQVREKLLVSIETWSQENIQLRLLKSTSWLKLEFFACYGYSGAD